MDDEFLCCGAFLVVLVGIAVVVLLVRRSGMRTRLDTLNADLGAARDDLRRLRDEIFQVRRRLAALEGVAPAALPPTGAVAPAPAEERAPAPPIETAPPAAAKIVAASPPDRSLPPPVAPENVVRAPDASAAVPAPAAPPARPAPLPFGIRPEQIAGEESPSPSPEFDWEQWVGVRGAAALGAIVLVVAGIFFFRYSIEHGLITPGMRVALGVAVGLGCILAGELRLHRTHETLARFLAGAGSAILYLAFWASSALYHLVPSWAAFGLMVLVSAACGLLAVRRGSLAIAVLGLLGGFATPILLSSGEDRPLELFGYLLLLNVGTTYVARRRYPILRALALAGTLFYQVAWIASRLDPERVALAIGILLVFTVFYAWSGRGSAAEDDGFLARMIRRMTLLTPSVFGLYFALRSELTPDLRLLAPMLLVLTAATSFVAHKERVAWLVDAAVGLALGVLFAWTMVHDLDANLAWQLFGAVSGLALVAHGGPEIAARRDRDRDVGLRAAIAASSVGFILLALRAVGAFVSVTPFVVAFAVLAVILVRQAVLFGRPELTLGAGLGLAFGLVGMHLAGAGSPGFPPEARVLGVLLAFGSAFQVTGFVGTPASRRFGDLGALVLALALEAHVGFLSPRAPLAELLGYGAVGVAMLLALVASAREVGGLGIVATVAVSVVAWMVAVYRVSSGPAWHALAVEGTALAALVASPIVFLARYRDDSFAWRAAAGAPMLFFLDLLDRYREAFGRGTIGLLPIALGALTLVLVVVAVRALPADRPTRRTAIVWAAGAALLHLAIAIPLQLRNEWVTIGWGFQGVALLALRRRLRHDGLLVLGVLLLAFVTTRLVVNPEVLDYHQASGRPIVNWLAYTYLVPALSLLGAWRLVSDDDDSRVRKWVAGGFALAALVVVFVWINLTIIDAFSPTGPLELSFSRRPARDLTLSIAWAVYALTLLGLGMWRRSMPLRGASLALILITVGKVFLYDLGNLSDLYRVASLVGLALSLIVISLGYRRFVFRQEGS